MEMNEQNTLIKVKHLQKFFPIKKKHFLQRKQEYVKANKDITIDIFENETLGLVGESGSGKSTLGRTLIQLYDQTAGVSIYYGETINEYMPAYVKKVANSIPKVFVSQSDDYQKVKRLSEQVKELEGDAQAEVSETLRLARIDYENKYGNILRLAGGLLAGDLNKARDLLLEKYEVGSKYAELEKEIEILEIRGKSGAKVNDDKIAALKVTLEKIKDELDKVIVKIEDYRQELVNEKHFQTFENYHDDGIDLSSLTKEEMRYLRKDVQIIFQDPYSSLDPRMTVGNIIGEGLIAHGIFDNDKSEGYNEYIQQIMEECGLESSYIHRYPHQFSGGQRQRIGIARALALRPKFIVCDEAVSALDVSIQSQVINLLQDLKDRFNLTYLFITHDLGVVRYISDRIAVMYLGNIVELAPADEIFSNPRHPYTRELLNAIPKMQRPGQVIEPLPLYVENDVFEFHYKELGEADKDWYEVAPDHFVACHLKDKSILEEEL